MQNVFKKSYYILKNNFVFVQPLFLYILLCMTALPYIINPNASLIPKICLLASIILMTIAFSAGWFHINMLGVLNYNADDSQNEKNIKALNNIKAFFEGVGANFFKTLSAYIISFVICIIVIYCVSKVCEHFFGIPEIIKNLSKLANASSNLEIVNFLNGFSLHDKLVLSAWIIAVNTTAFILNFLVILYFGVINIEKTNVFKGLWLEIKFLIKNIFYSIYVILFTGALYILMNTISVILGSNIISFIILTLLTVTYLNYCVILVFCFYNDKTRNNSNSGAEFIG